MYQHTGSPHPERDYETLGVILYYATAQGNNCMPDSSERVLSFCVNGIIAYLGNNPIKYTGDEPGTTEPFAITAWKAYTQARDNPQLEPSIKDSLDQLLEPIGNFGDRNTRLQLYLGTGITVEAGYRELNPRIINNMTCCNLTTAVHEQLKAIGEHARPHLQQHMTDVYHTLPV